MALSVLLILQVSFSLIGDAQEGCTNRDGERALSACYSQRAERWERRMEKAYQDALQHPNGYDRPALIRAQNQWLRYRRAACDFYAKQDGTIAYIESAYCMLDLTRRRALELEKIPEI